MASNKKYNITYKVNHDEYRILVLNNSKKVECYKTVSKDEYYNLQNKYEMMNGYSDDNIDQNLFNYYKDFYKWNNELYQEGIDTFYYSYYNDLAVIKTFSKLSSFDLKNNDHITEIETKYFEGCNNGYLEYGCPGEFQSYGYDMNGFYPRMLGENKLKIPIKEGYEVKLSTLDKYNLKFGFYKVIIECYDEDFVKIFKFSENNIYTHYSLLFAYNYQNEYDIKIELNLNEEYNAYLYNDSDIIETKSIFGDWFKKLMAVKAKYPKNKLIKHLLSSVWGSLSRKNYNEKIKVTEDDLEKYDEELYTLAEYDHEKNLYYIIKKQNRYKYNIRLKPFLLSYARCYMGRIAHDNHLDQVIRLCCDNITYKSDVTINIPNFLPEEKTTGKIFWKNARLHDERCSCKSCLS